MNDIPKVRLLEVPEKRRIAVDQPVPVHITFSERDLLLEHGFLDAETEKKLADGRAIGDAVVCLLTLSDIDYILGDVAAVANHAGDEEVSDVMYELFDWLRLHEDLYADEQSSPESPNEIRIPAESMMMLQLLGQLETE